MADRIIYLVDSIPKFSSDQVTVELIDHEGLAALMSEGYEVINTIADRKITVGRKTVKATMMILRPSGENRGVSLRQEREQEGGGSAMATIVDDFGQSKAVSVGQAMVHQTKALANALARLGDTGHLGGARSHNHINYVSAEMIGKAFDVGVAAGKSGQPKSANPFPAGSTPGMKWLQGWMAAGKGQEVEPEYLKEAEKAGYQTAKSFGEDDTVSPPYPPNSPLHEAWVRGFKRGGGRVE